MKIALHFLSPLGSHGVEWVEVSNTDELRRWLEAKKVLSFVRYSRCIGTDDGRCEGEIVSVDALTQDDLDWASEKEPTRSRYLSCVRPIA
jgi:hypothetical protein